MKAVPITVVAIGITVLAIIAGAIWMLVDAGQRSPTAVPGSAASGKPDGAGGGRPAATPIDPYPLLTGRAEDAVLELAGRPTAWSLPALPDSGTLTWIRTWEFHGQAGKAKVEADWQLGSDGTSAVLTEIRRPGLPSIAELTIRLGTTLTLTGPVPADAGEKGELERLGRQLLFLLRGSPTGAIAGGDERTLGGQPFRFVPLDGTRALLVAQDCIASATPTYPATSGVLSEVQYQRDTAGALVSVTRIIANHRAEQGTLNVERLELR
jgi:hypothetical protein